MAGHQEIRIKFDQHGLGDCVHAAIALQLYRKRGYKVSVRIEQNKRWIWQVAGVEIIDDDAPNHGYPYVPDLGSFFNLNLPDHESAKAAGFFAHEALPVLGTKEEVWRELCSTSLSAHEHIPRHAYFESDRFLEGLPRPIFVLHSKGSNWQAEKSIPDGVAFELILRLLDQTEGSVIILDYDARAPFVSGHPRCKAIKPEWGHIGIDRLCALLERTDLLIGVDSGPFHVANLVDVNALGVFRRIPPARCCLPNRLATYLVSATLHEHWEARKADWRFVEYAGPEPSAEEISNAAMAVLSGPRVVPVADPTPESVAGRYLYRRVGYDERLLELLSGGIIGEGSASCERSWKLVPTPRDFAIGIFDETGGDTCWLAREEESIWRGKWLAFEKMPIELIKQH